MEKSRKTLNLIATSQNPNFYHLPFIPIFSFASLIYKVSLFIRHKLYFYNILQKHRLPVPVISVGNLTWGGNGKTPMTEFVARLMAEAGVAPLILTRGYAGGDEAKMLHRHLSETTVRIGVGANRIAVASSVIKKYGHMCNSLILEKLSSSYKSEPGHENTKVGVVILDDGMQVSDAQLGVIETTVKKENASVSVYFTRLTPLYFFDVKNSGLKLPLTIVYNNAVLCVSGIGFSDAFVEAVIKIGPFHVDRLDFSDHHPIQSEDLEIIRKRVQEVQNQFETKTIVVVTEKDYDRDPLFLKEQDDLTILVLCSSIQFIPSPNHTEEAFRVKLNSLLINKTRKS